MKKPLALCLLCAAGAAQAQVIAGKAPGGAAGGGGGEEANKPTLTIPEHKFYIGADWQNLRLSVSDPNSVGGIAKDDYDTKFYDIRVGYRLFEAIGVEAHYGIPDTKDGDPGKVKQDHYYAAFVVPTATVFEAFELALPIGYTNSKVIHRDASGAEQRATLGGLGFGARIEVPIRVFWSDLPDVRLTGGGLVNYQKSGAREYGYHFGLRYDFGLFGL